MFQSAVGTTTEPGSAGSVTGGPWNVIVSPSTPGYQVAPLSVLFQMPARPATMRRAGFNGSIWTSPTTWFVPPSSVAGTSACRHTSPLGPPTFGRAPLVPLGSGVQVAPPSTVRQTVAHQPRTQAASLSSPRRTVSTPLTTSPLTV